MSTLKLWKSLNFSTLKVREHVLTPPGPGVTPWTIGDIAGARGCTFGLRLCCMLLWLVCCDDVRELRLRWAADVTEDHSDAGDNDGCDRLDAAF